MLRAATMLALALLLAGCTGGAKIKVRFDASDARPALKLVKPGPVKLERVKWIVVTRDNAESVLAGLGDKAVVIAVTPDGFSKLQRNNAQLLFLVKRYRKIVLAYETYQDKP